MGYKIVTIMQHRGGLPGDYSTLVIMKLTHVSTERMKHYYSLVVALWLVLIRERILLCQRLPASPQIMKVW